VEKTVENRLNSSIRWASAADWRGFLKAKVQKAHQNETLCDSHPLMAANWRVAEGETRPKAIFGK